MVKPALGSNIPNVYFEYGWRLRELSTQFCLRSPIHTNVKRCTERQQNGNRQPAGQKPLDNRNARNGAPKSREILQPDATTNRKPNDTQKHETKRGELIDLVAIKQR